MHSQVKVPLGPQYLTRQCPYCTQLSTFSTKASLKQHISLKHRDAHMIAKTVKNIAEATCSYCNQTYSRKTYCKQHEMVCQEKLGAQLKILAGDDFPPQQQPNLEHVIFSKKTVPNFSIGDGTEDIREWEQRVNEINVNERAPVAIQCDIRLLNWHELVRVQLAKYQSLFQVILMDPPWKVRIDLKYPVLSDEQILSIPFEMLKSDGYLMIWILDMKEEKIKAMLKKRGYKYKAKLVWGKVTKNDKLVNGSGYTARHSTETLYIFARGNVKSISKFHKMNDLILSRVQGESVKPESIIERIHQLVPYGFFLEIFARLHNLRANYVSIGNQVKPAKNA